MTARSSNNKKFETLPAGTYPGYLIQVVDIGMQPRSSFDNQEKGPAPHIMLTYELADEFMKDEDGQEIKEKPLWRTETQALFNLKVEQATSSKRYKVLDPSGVANGDFARLLGTPVNISIINNPGSGKNAGRVFEKIVGISAMRDKDAAKLPGMKNKPRVFDLDAPDMAIYNSFSDYVKGRILANLEFKGSKLEGLIEASKGTGAKMDSPPPMQSQEDGDEENPF